MRKLFAFVLFLSCAQLALGQTLKTKAAVISKSAAVTAPAATAQASEVVFNWQYTTSIPICGSSLKNCYSGFTMTYTNTNTVIGTPSNIGPTALSYTWAPTGGLSYGSLGFSLVANGYDLNGKAIVSTPATVTVINGVTTLDAPTALQGATGSVQ